MFVCLRQAESYFGISGNQKISPVPQDIFHIPWEPLKARGNIQTQKQIITKWARYRLRLNSSPASFYIKYSAIMFLFRLRAKSIVQLSSTHFISLKKSMYLLTWCIPDMKPNIIHHDEKFIAWPLVFYEPSQFAYSSYYTHNLNGNEGQNNGSKTYVHMSTSCIHYIL